MFKGLTNILCAILLVSILFLSGCATTQAADTQVNLNSEFNKMYKLEGKAQVVMVVKGQPITIEVDGTNAPITAGNFIDLVSRGFYNGLKFHRVIKAPEPFVVQGGDPLGNGTGSYKDPETKQERYIPLEIKPKGAAKPIYSKTFKELEITEPPELPHKKGAIAMARAPLPDSASSQFYFTLADLPFLDGDYAVFGYVTEGMEVVENIQKDDKIDSATVISGQEFLTK